MKKEQQSEINKNVKIITDDFNRVISIRFTQRLYHCTAEVLFCNGGFIALKSYNTIVAIYSIDTGILYDCLRYVYGYTATSAQHISKFKKWLKETRHTVDSILTYKDI